VGRLPRVKKSIGPIMLRHVCHFPIIIARQSTNITK